MELPLSFSLSLYMYVHGSSTVAFNPALAKHDGYRINGLAGQIGYCEQNYTSADMISGWDHLVLKVCGLQIPHTGAVL